MDDANEETPPASSAESISEQGGESACLAHLLCPGCGIVIDDGAHAPGSRGNCRGKRTALWFPTSGDGTAPGRTARGAPSRAPALNTP